MAHDLDPLLCPESIAVIGASQREDAVGNMVLFNLLAGQYRGQLYAVNPRYSEVEKVPCFPSPGSLPSKVEHAIFAVSDERIEQLFQEAIDHGIKAATIYSSLVLENDSAPFLPERIKNQAKKAGVLLCGANGMGFYNFTKNTWACGFDTRHHSGHGNVSLISQSGSGMSGILDVDERIDFNLAVSTGQELVVGLEDYLDFALEQDETRVIGLFMETSRQPRQLLAAFRKARSRKIPIVALKVGRTELASKLAESHSGAMAGVDAVYDAVFDYYGVQRVHDMDELATALIMFAQPYEVAQGGLVTIHDSGGERQLLIDLADKCGVELTVLEKQSVAELEDLLDPGLPAVNPLDAWSAGGPAYHEVMQKCFASLLCDPGAAFGAVVHDRAPGGKIYSSYINYLRHGHEVSGKPVFLVAARQGTGEDDIVLDATREGFPVVDGVSSFLEGARCMLSYRDYLERVPASSEELADDNIRKWQEWFADAGEVSEFQASCFLSDCGIAMLLPAEVNNVEELREKAREISYPLVMKTAEAGVRHKSDQQGVVLNIQNESDLLAAYRDLATRIGEKVLLAPMHKDDGIEMILGIVNDSQFGPLVLMGFGGVHAEIIEDSVLALPPFDASYAALRMEQLKMRKVLDGARGKTAMDVDAYCQAAAGLSRLAVNFADQLAELDINPVKVMSKGCVGLDAMLILKHSPEGMNEHGKQGYG